MEHPGKGQRLAIPEETKPVRPQPDSISDFLPVELFHLCQFLKAHTGGSRIKGQSPNNRRMRAYSRAPWRRFRSRTKAGR